MSKTFREWLSSLEKAQVKNPGSRGGQYWIDGQGRVRYGKKPQGKPTAPSFAAKKPRSTAKTWGKRAAIAAGIYLLGVNAAQIGYDYRAKRSVMKQHGWNEQQYKIHVWETETADLRHDALEMFLSVPQGAHDTLNSDHAQTLQALQVLLTRINKYAPKEAKPLSMGQLLRHAKKAENRDINREMYGRQQGSQALIVRPYS